LVAPSSCCAVGAASRPDIIALNDEALSLRETIRVDATALAHHGLIDPKRLDSFKGLIGYKNVASGLGKGAGTSRAVLSAFGRQDAGAPVELAAR
jgi:hypothetical protein